MNITIIRLLGKVLKFLFVTFSTLFNIYPINEQTFGIYNTDINKSLNVVSTIVEHKTNVTYSSKVPTGITNVLVEGRDGIIYKDAFEGTYQTLKEPIDEIIEIGTGKYGEFTGIVTGYGPDCHTCDGRGYVACPTKTGKWTNLITDGNFYEDERYGSLQILAADWREFPCGTVIEVNNNDLEKPILGVVLDTGYAMRKAYDNGYVHIDVAFKTEKGLVFNTNKNTKFSVKRWGW